MNNKKVYFVQGYGMSSPAEKSDWPNWLGQQLSKYGFEFIYLAMPDSMYPEVNEWLDFLNQQKIEVNNDTYFVSHSLGCITVARFLEKLPKGNVAGGCIFVSGFSSPLGMPILDDFCKLPIDFSEVRKHSKKSVVVISDNDHIISPMRSKEFAEKMGAEIIMEHKKGHFITGTKRIPSVLNSILEMNKINIKKNIWSFLDL